MESPEILAAKLLIAATEVRVSLLENAGARGWRMAPAVWTGAEPLALLHSGGRVFAAADDGLWLGRESQHRSGPPRFGWERLPGVPQSKISFLAGGGPVLYAAGNGGSLLVSRDWGANWAASDGLKKAVESGTPEVQAMGLDPARPAIIAAALEGGAILLSTDYGETWNTVGKAPSPVVSLEVSYYRREDVVYAATASGFFKGRALDVPRRASRSLEESWQFSNGGLTMTHCTAMAVRRVRGETILLACVDENGGGASPAEAPISRGEGGAIFRSVDYGARWERVRGGLPEPAPRFTALCYDRADPFVAFAGTADGAIYYCTEAGDSWHPLFSGLAPIRALLAL